MKTDHYLIKDPIKLDKSNVLDETLMKQTEEYACFYTKGCSIGTELLQRDKRFKDIYFFSLANNPCGIEMHNFLETQSNEVNKDDM